MTDNNDVKLKRLIVHILDNNLQLPVLSDIEHPSDDEAYGFIENHIAKILKDDNIKAADFIDENNKISKICRRISDNQEEFKDATVDIAEMLYQIMQKNPDIPSADVACCLFNADDDKYLGILKFNYRPSYIHYVGNDSSGRVNSIIKQKTALPGESQKVEECALINLRDFSIKLLEKKYEINGEKLFYFSTIFLECSTDMSDKEKIKIFKKATEKFNKRYCAEDITKSADMRKAIAESIEQNDAIDVENVADNVFRRNPGMKNAYIEHIEKAGLKDKSIAISEELTEKVFKKHKIKTDTGIEINLPVDYYKDKNKVEFINNPDGTISIMLKNISSIVDC